MKIKKQIFVRLNFMALATLAWPHSALCEEADAALDLDGPELDGPEQNASNPLAKVSNTDVRWQYLDHVAGQGHLNDNEIPANGEVQFGKNFNRCLARYLDALGGIG